MPISIFDIAGPIMVGPSSSHTAGACKIGQLARALFNGTPSKVDFYLYGSFATVYQGHATDRALLAGVMKFMTSDPLIKEAFVIAKKKKIEYRFIPVNALTPEHHPNTVRIILKNRKRQLSVVGSSIGGGRVQITHINNVPIDLEASAGRFFSLIVGHDNSKYPLAPLYSKLKEWHCPIADKKTFSVKQHSLTLLNIENHVLKLPQVLELEKLPGVHFVRALTKLLKY
ncbi:MAG: L-serine ammonia-lyase, iron-sulfur-dependent subunit beta [Candidatus Peregrinibacteria bacterium]